MELLDVRATRYSPLFLYKEDDLCTPLFSTRDDVIVVVWYLVGNMNLLPQEMDDILSIQFSSKKRKDVKSMNKQRGVDELEMRSILIDPSNGNDNNQLSSNHLTESFDSFLQTKKQYLPPTPFSPYSFFSPQNNDLLIFDASKIHQTSPSAFSGAYEEMITELKMFFRIKTKK